MSDFQKDTLAYCLEELNFILKSESLSPHESTQIIQAISSLTYALQGPADVSH